jgi:hypothetical protein
LAVTGFSFWLVPLWRSIGGLFVAGLGIANLFPLTPDGERRAAAPGQCRQQPDHAGSGLAILITPQVLGSRRPDGIRSAFAVAAAFLLVATGAIWVANCPRAARVRKSATLCRSLP